MLPEGFKKRMKLLLKDEYDGFISTLLQPAVKGLRVNTARCAPDAPISEGELPLISIPYVKGGYIIDGEVASIGNTPSHLAGRFYIQDPGAMSTAAAIDIPPDAWVADLCAAPGGKTTQLAQMLGEGGFILSNEYVPKRAKILVGNVERMGIANACVTSMDTKELARLYNSVFDLVVADAPCSGEGMFRKDVPAIEEWSEDNVTLCAARQADILDNAAALVKGGGKLLYSTCTYSLEENEMTVAAFIERHPEFSLIPVKPEVASVTSDGVRFDGCTCRDIELCRRFYPHKTQGEGQFIALMQKNNDELPTFLYKEKLGAPTKDEMAAVEAFYRANLTKKPGARLAKYGENLVLISHGCPLPPHSVFSAGVLLGEVKGKLLFPSHQLFKAYGDLFKNKLFLDEEEAKKYLSGEEIADNTGLGGFVALYYRDCVLGGGKASGDRIKNHFPKGLRVR